VASNVAIVLVDGEIEYRVLWRRGWELSRLKRIVEVMDKVEARDKHRERHVTGQVIGQTALRNKAVAAQY